MISVCVHVGVGVWVQNNVQDVNVYLTVSACVYVIFVIEEECVYVCCVKWGAVYVCATVRQA